MVLKEGGIVRPQALAEGGRCGRCNFDRVARLVGEVRLSFNCLNFIVLYFTVST